MAGAKRRPTKKKAKSLPRRVSKAPSSPRRKKKTQKKRPARPLSIAEAARRLGVSPRALRALTQAKKTPPHKKPTIRLKKKARRALPRGQLRPTPRKKKKKAPARALVAPAPRKKRRPLAKKIAKKVAKKVAKKLGKKLGKKLPTRAPPRPAKRKRAPRKKLVRRKKVRRVEPELPPEQAERRATLTEQIRKIRADIEAGRLQRPAPEPPTREISPEAPMPMDEASQLLGHAMRDYVMARFQWERDLTHTQFWELKFAFRKTFGVRRWKKTFEWIVDEWGLEDFIFDREALRDS